MSTANSATYLFSPWVLLLLLLLLMLESSLVILICLWVLGLCSATVLTQILTTLVLRYNGNGEIWIWIVRDPSPSPPSPTLALSSHQQVAKASQSHSSSPAAGASLDHQYFEVDGTPPSQWFYSWRSDQTLKQMQQTDVIGNVKCQVPYLVDPIRCVSCHQERKGHHVSSSFRIALAPQASF